MSGFLTNYFGQGGSSFYSSAGGSTTFTPSSVPNLTLWLTAGKGISLSGSNITSWADQSTAGNNFVTTGSNFPTFQASGINSLPSVRASAPSILVCVNPATSILSGTAAERFIVIQDNPSQSTGFFGENWSANPLTIPSGDQSYICYSGGTTYDSFFSTGYKIPSTTAFYTTPTIYNTISAPGEWTAHINGAQVFTTTSNTTGASGSAKPTLFAAQSNIGYNWVGIVSEILVYARKLTTIERANVYAYLSAKYGLLPPTYVPSMITNPAIILDAGFGGLTIDQSPNTNNFTPIGSPTIAPTAGPNATPAMAFNGTSQYLELLNHSINLGVSFSIVMIAKLSSTAIANSGVFTACDTGAGDYQSPNGLLAWASGYQIIGGQAFPTGLNVAINGNNDGAEYPLSMDTWHCVSLEYDGTTGTVNADGGSVGSFSVSTAIAPSTWGIGGRTSGSSVNTLAPCSVAAIYVYSAKLSVGDKAKLQTYISSYFGLSL